MATLSTRIPKARRRGLMSPAIDELIPVYAARSNAGRWVPWLLALFLAVWSMRTVGTNNIVDTDAARHAMNGAFIRDLVASGQITHPIQYGKYYYGHLPALSLLFHPPLFP